MISMIRTNTFRVLAASLVAAAALSLSASEAKAMDVRVTVENHRGETIGVLIDGNPRTIAPPDGHGCFTVECYPGDCFTVTVVNRRDQVLLSQDVQVRFPARNYTFHVH